MDIISRCYEGGLETDRLLDESEQAIFAIADSRTTKGTYSAKDLVTKVFEQIEKRMENKELVTGVPTGYYQFDEYTAGLQPSDLIIVAGRPSMGKTAFAMNVAMRAAAMHGVPTAIFSLEMSMEQIMQRMLCCWGKVDLSHLRRGRLDDEDWSRLYDAANHLTAAPIFVDDTAAITTMAMPEVGQDYLIILERDGFLDNIRVKVEIRDAYFVEDMRVLGGLQKRIAARLRDEILVTPRVELVEPGSLPKSEGKANRVRDLRGEDKA